MSVVLFYLLSQENTMGCITLKYTKWILGVCYVVFAYVDAVLLKAMYHMSYHKAHSWYMYCVREKSAKVSSD
jgi:hypothetical protein